ncbi:hypothetical protein GCM10010464_58080 [Pseudonocardia yunnanensis]|uniref:Helix-turn-helix domain-containing protein n=1 Tax=Pseudonocardia yunnanensis TaxID=58107 RepID=A0ABW4F711_9PSEU
MIARSSRRGCVPPSLRAGLARARIVLPAADGAAVKDIVERVGASKPTVIGWRTRYAAEGLGGLEDRPKRGRRRVIDEVVVVLPTPPTAATAVTVTQRVIPRPAGSDLDIPRA